MENMAARLLLLLISATIAASKEDGCQQFMDTASEGWGGLADLNTPRMGHTAVTFNNKMYAIGGLNRKGNLGSVETFDLHKARRSSMYTVAA